MKTFQVKMSDEMAKGVVEYNQSFGYTDSVAEIIKGVLDDFAITVKEIGYMDDYHEVEVTEVDDK